MAIMAKFPGKCTVCGERIEEDDMIEADGDGGWCHEECKED